MITLTDEDLEALTPSKPFKIGEKEIKIRPLTLSEWPDLTRKVSEIAHFLTEKGINLNNYEDHITDLVSIIVDKSPELLSLISKIEPVSLGKLPIGYTVQLFSICMEVNLHDKELLRKNLETLQEQFLSILDEVKVTGDQTRDSAG